MPLISWRKSLNRLTQQLNDLICNCWVDTWTFLQIKEIYLLKKTREDPEFAIFYDENIFTLKQVLNQQTQNEDDYDQYIKVDQVWFRISEDFSN